MNTPTYTSGLLQVKAYRILQSQVSNSLERYGLSPTTWSILGLINENQDGIRLSEIASNINVEAPHITTLVDQLQNMAIVEKHDHPTDKRAKLLFLTSKGKSLISPVEGNLNQVLLKLLNGVTESELGAYQTVLETIVKNAELK